MCAFHFKTSLLLSQPCKCNSSIMGVNCLNAIQPSSLVLIITWPNFSTSVLNNLTEEEWKKKKSYLLDLTVLGALSQSN